MREVDVITKIAALFPRSPAQKNALFEADAELFELNGSLLAISTDEFSPEEDFFAQFFPERLGYNLVAATLSDLLAAGADPRFLVHAFSAPKGASAEFLEGLCRGMSEALSESSCYLLGGDFGTCESWRYVGTALGTVEKPLRRSGAQVGAVLCTTGKFGSGNLAAFLLAGAQSGQITLDDSMKQLASPKFPCRIRAARCLRKYASFAMDSSDGFLSSLMQLSRCNGGVQFRAKLNPELVLPEGTAVLKSVGMPSELLLMGSAGEYELVFGVPADRFAEFSAEMTKEQIPFLQIGEICQGEGVTLELDTRVVAVESEQVPDPREMSTGAYIEKLGGLLHSWKTGACVVDVFSPASIGKVQLRNRVLRSATFEGSCDADGKPTEAYTQMLVELAKNGVGGIVTGFVAVAPEGRAMQPGQGTLYAEEHTAAFAETVRAVHAEGVPIFAQIAHTGRQTREQSTGMVVRGVSRKRSWYFLSKPVPFSTSEVDAVVESFVQSAMAAKQAGFDGVQIHAAHGYLVHQFLLPQINNRSDEYGIDKETKLGTHFLERVVSRIRLECGEDFPILVKVSWGVDLFPPLRRNHFEKLIEFLDRIKVDAIEISYGTMDYAMSIFRGDIPVDALMNHNPLFATKNPLLKQFRRRVLVPIVARRMKPYASSYNLAAARQARSLTKIPLILVGGLRNLQDVSRPILEDGIDFVSLSRPLIAEPTFVSRLRNEPGAQSACTNCNLCAVMCDSSFATRCYRVVRPAP